MKLGEKQELFMRNKIAETLNEMNRYSPEAVELLFMIAAHESKLGKYRRQIGGGPALGIYQIEPVTHDSIWDNCDSIYMLAKQMNIVRNVDALVNDDRYSTFVARCYLLMDKKPLPKTPEAMAKYCKSYWNRTGKATPEQYLDAYNKLVIGVKQ